MTIPGLNLVFCFKDNVFMAYLMIWKRKKEIYSFREW